MNETDIDLQAKKAKASVDSLNKSLANIDTSLKNINSTLNTLDKKTNASVKETIGALDKLKDTLDIISEFKSYNEVLNKTGTCISSLSGYVRVYSSLAKGDLSQAIDGNASKLSTLTKGIQGGTNAWLKNIGVLTKTNIVVGTLAVSWSSFAKQYKENDKFRDSVNSIYETIKPLIDYCKKLYNSIKTIIDSVVNNFVGNISTSMKAIKDIVTLDFDSLFKDLSSHGEGFGNNFKNIGISILNALPFVDIQTEAEKMAERLKEVEKSLFNNDGMSLDEYKHSLEEMLSTISNNTPNIGVYNESIESSKIKYKEAGESLQILLSQMGTSTYADTAEDINKLNNNLDTMTESVKISGQAFTDATTSIVNNLLEEGRISQETATQVIEAAQLKAKIENDTMEQYRLKILQLDEDRKKGKITLDEYSQKQREIAEELFRTDDIVAKTRTSILNYEEQLDKIELNCGSWEELNGVLDDIGDTYEKNQNQLNDNIKSHKEMMESLQVFFQQEIDAQNKKLLNLQENGKAETEEYRKEKEALDDYVNKNQEITEIILGLNGKKKDDSLELKRITIDSILGIVNQMKESGVDLETNGKDTVAKINEQMKRLGLKDEINLNQNLDDIRKEIYSKLGYNISDIVEETNGEFSKIGEGVDCTVYIKGNTDDATKKINSLVGKLASIGVVGVAAGTLLSLNNLMGSAARNISIYKKANGGIYSNGSWKSLPQYANGGIPSHGSVFVAGERGAEIVGHINGKTEVLNQSQIASAIYSAMMNAMSKFNGGGIAEINVHADQGLIVETAVNGINKHIKQTGELPFAIPVH